MLEKHKGVGSSVPFLGPRLLGEPVQHVSPTRAQKSGIYLGRGEAGRARNRLPGPVPVHCDSAGLGEARDPAGLTRPVCATL